MHRSGSNAAGATTPSRPRRSTPTCPWTTSWPGWERRAENAAAYRRKLGLDPDDRLTPDPDALYPSRLRAMMPEPPEQVGNSLAVKLARAEKQALDLLAAWPLCTTDQLAGLMGGVTRRRANQVLRSLANHGLVRADGPLHVLTDEGLKYLARRGPGRRGARSWAAGAPNPATGTRRPMPGLPCAPWRPSPSTTPL